MGGKVVVTGSSNTDMVVYSKSLPAPGETVLGGEFLMNPGGKGANQAVAASKLGADVTFLACLGDDVFGHNTLNHLKDLGINTSNVSVHKNTASGVALILVNDEGENSIAVAPGANNKLSIEQLNAAAPAFTEAQVALFQLESPVSVVEAGLILAKEKNCITILNPAPAQKLSGRLLSKVDVLTPNESEAGLLTGIPVRDDKSARLAATELHHLGVETVIITMGSRGAFLSDSEYQKVIPAPQVKAVDTTAAGDTFNGALAVALSENQSILSSIDFANHAAALSVTRKGAQSSVPDRKDLN